MRFKPGSTYQVRSHTASFKGVYVKTDYRTTAALFSCFVEDSEGDKGMREIWVKLRSIELWYEIPSKVDAP